VPKKTTRKLKPLYRQPPPKPERGIHSASTPKREPVPKRKGWSSDFSLFQSGKETPDKLKLELQQKDFVYATTAMSATKSACSFKSCMMRAF